MDELTRQHESDGKPLRSSSANIAIEPTVGNVDALALLHLVAQRVNPALPPTSTEVPWPEVSMELVSLARAHGVLAAAHDSPAVGQVPDDVRTVLSKRARQQKLKGIWQLGATAKVLRALAKASVLPLVIKGQAFSTLVYGDWSARGTSTDLDLLVSQSEVGLAEEVLRSLGFRPQTIQSKRVDPQSGSVLSRYALWLHYERTWLSPELGAVDLHWRALPGGAQWNLGEDLLRRAIEVELPIGPVRTLSLADSVIVACSQGESEKWLRLKRLADLAAIQRRCSDLDIATAEGRSTLVQPSIASLTQRWIGMRSPTKIGSSLSHRAVNLWRMRRGSGGPLDAALRSSLGAVFPSRRFGRKA